MRGPGKLVSVVIPTYNRCEIVTRAIDSVLAQTYSPVEILVVDDASTDGSASTLKKYIDSGKIRLIVNAENRGVSHSRNRGILEAKGHYIAFLDSDDVFWAKDKIAKQLEAAEASGGKEVFVFCNSRCRLFNGDEHLHTVCSKGFHVNRGNTSPMFQPLPNPSHWFVSADFREKVGLFDENLQVWEDVDFAFRVYKAGFKGLYVEEALVGHFEESLEHLSATPGKYLKAKEIFARKNLPISNAAERVVIFRNLAKENLMFKNFDKAANAYWNAFLCMPGKVEFFGKAVYFAVLHIGSKFPKRVAAQR